MPLYSDFGDVLVKYDELIERAEEVRIFSDDSSGVDTIKFPGGLASSKEWKAKKNQIPHVPIGMQKPLSILISQIYTGKTIKNTRDMMVTSAVKGIGQGQAAPRFINFLENNVGERKAFEAANATKYGTPLIYYSPAQMEVSLALTVEFGFDSIQEELADLLNSIASVGFGAAMLSGFDPATSFVFVAAGGIMRVAGNVVKNIPREPAFSQTVNLNFDLPGEVTAAQFHLITQEEIDNNELKNLQINNSGKLVYKDGTVYNGDIPYVVISLDGKRREEFSKFSAVAASATLLEQYFGMKEGNNQSIEQLLEALQLYNDLHWRKKADEQFARLSTLESESSEYKDTHNAINGFLANIQEELIRPQYEF